MKLQKPLLAFALLVSFRAFAAPAATVEGMQMPAWVERGGQRAPLQVGTTLASGDKVRTGSGARVLMRLEESSHVKLGEDAVIDLATLEPPADPTGVFKGVLDVVKGAFRFTTSAIGKQRARDIQARVATVTIGIRGTDVWGKAEPTRDFVVLLEGKIDIQRGDEPAQRMETPMSLFMAPKGIATLPIAPVDPNDLQRWAQETELQDESGVVTSDGAWTLHLASYRKHSGATQVLQTLHDAGYAAYAEGVTVGGGEWTRLSVGGFASRADAEAVARSLQTQFVFPEPWVTQSR